MSNNEHKEFKSLGQFLSEMLEEVFSRESIDVTIGDKVLASEMSSVTYMVPLDSKNTVGSGYEKHHRGLNKYFTEVPGIVTQVNLDFKYKCGHCSREHKHDMLVYYKEINQSFYTSSHAIKLAEEEKKE